MGKCEVHFSISSFSLRCLARARSTSWTVCATCLLIAGVVDVATSSLAKAASSAGDTSRRLSDGKNAAEVWEEASECGGEDSGVPHIRESDMSDTFGDCP